MELCEIFQDRQRRIFGEETPVAPISFDLQSINEREISQSRTYEQAEHLPKSTADSENQHQKRNAQPVRGTTKHPVVGHGNVFVFVVVVVVV